MNAENHEVNPYTAVLADLRKKRAEIDQMIKGLEAISGLGVVSAVGLASASPRAIGISANSSESTQLDEGAFHGMSIADATKKLLAFRKRKMGNPEIARALAAGGLVMKSADPVNTVGAVLTRRFQQVGDIVKIDRGTWGLKEWYPGRTFKPAIKPPAPPDNGKGDSGVASSEFDDLLGDVTPKAPYDL